MTVIAFKGKQGPCLERNQAVVYRGPFKTVQDDDAHTYHRGLRTAVCDKTFQLLTKAPYHGSFTPIEPIELIPLDEACAFDCDRNRLRDPRETKGLEYSTTTEASGPNCGTDGVCC